MGDVQHGRAELAADPDDLELERLAELAVERAERLVHQQQARLEHDRARQRDPLLLPARHLARVALGQVAQLDELEGVGDAAVDIGP